MPGVTRPTPTSKTRRHAHADRRGAFTRAAGPTAKCAKTPLPPAAGAAPTSPRGGPPTGPYPLPRPDRRTRNPPHTRGFRNDAPSLAHRAVADGGVPAYPAPWDQASINMRSLPQFLRLCFSRVRKPPRDHHLSQSRPLRTRWCDFQRSIPGDMMLSVAHAAHASTATRIGYSPHSCTLCHIHTPQLWGLSGTASRGENCTRSISPEAPTRYTARTSASGRSGLPLTRSRSTTKPPQA